MFAARFRKFFSSWCHVALYGAGDSNEDRPEAFGQNHPQHAGVSGTERKAPAGF
jgi:hypothetical protein